MLVQPLRHMTEGMHFRYSQIRESRFNDFDHRLQPFFFNISVHVVNIQTLTFHLQGIQQTVVASYKLASFSVLHHFRSLKWFMERLIQIYRFDFQTSLVSLSPICLILLLEEVGNALCGVITVVTLHHSNQWLYFWEGACQPTAKG